MSERKHVSLFFIHFDSEEDRTSGQDAIFSPDVTQARGEGEGGGGEIALAVVIQESCSTSFSFVATLTHIFIILICLSHHLIGPKI